MSTIPSIPVSTRIVTMNGAEFAERFGCPDVREALCGYTRENDTRVVLTLLVHAQPRRVLEVGTGLGHMTANLTRWTPADARVFTIELVRGMARAAPGAAEQEVEMPGHADWGRFANHFGTAHKAFFITAGTMTYDFGRIAPIEFAFIDGAHDLEHVLNDSRKTYGALAPGGWLVWHDFDSSVPWVKVREAIERVGFAEAVVHVEGTEVAFLHKGSERIVSRRVRREDAPAAPVLTGRCVVEDSTHPTTAETRTAGAPVLTGRCVVEDSTHPTTRHHWENDKIGILSHGRVAWEGDFKGLHSLALVNRAICRGLLERGLDLALIQVETGPNEGRVALDGRLAARMGKTPAGLPAQVHVRQQWPPRLEPPAQGRWVLMQPWEYGSLPKAWLPMLRRVDEVWAYSRFVRDCYLEAGVPPERVHVVPRGVDPEVFRPGLEPLPLPPGPSPRFLFVGGTIFRKGIDLLLTAFGRAFHPTDDVGLVIKDMGSKSFYRGQTAEANVAGLRERGYLVEYIDRTLSETELARLYAACDCLVHPFRGEGFALPVVEAMACGLPVIVTGAGPAVDYATEETAYLIPARRGQFAECRVGDLETIGRPWLHEPDLDVLVELLKRVASDRAGARAKGMVASEHIRNRFTWGHTAEAAERRLVALAGENQNQPRTSGSMSSSRTVRTSLTMIVRDEQENLPHCLGSVAGLFDEVVVVDTGSTDRTAAIAREFGVRVFDFVWVNDFAAARNAALARAKGDYAFWLDADDVLDPPQRVQLQALLNGLRPGDEAAYVVRCSCDPGPNGDGGQTVVDHIRLFPVREDVRWTYAVHEQILPALRRANVPVRWTDVNVRHTGYTDPALRERKLQRDCKILEAELAERPDDPFVLFNLGSIAVERQDWSTALGHLQRSLRGSAPTDSIVRKLFALIARCHQMLGDIPAALGVCSEGLRIDPDDAELHFRKAVLHRKAGQPAEAEACWRRILTLKRPDQFCSVDQGIYGHLTLRNLAVLAEERSDPESRRLWRMVLDACPGDSEAMSRGEASQ